MKITGNRPGSSAGTTGIKAYAATPRPVPAAPSTGNAQAPEAVPSVLGIPEAEFTPSVQKAITELMAEVARLREDLERTRSRLESIQAVADQDPLLPVLNRRAFVREMSRIMSFGERYEISASLIYFDLDGLKAINDRFGHAAGDAALRHVAGVLAAHVRESDIVGRLGGDEFGVILAKADLEQAENKARSLAETLSATPLSWQGGIIPLSAAYGVHEFRKGEQPDAAMANADRAMYEAKKSRAPG